MKTRVDNESRIEGDKEYNVLLLDLRNQYFLDKELALIWIHRPVPHRKPLIKEYDHTYKNLP